MEKSTSLHIIIEVKMFKIKSAVKQISLMLAIPAKKKKKKQLTSTVYFLVRTIGKILIVSNIWSVHHFLATSLSDDTFANLIVKLPPRLSRYQVHFWTHKCPWANCSGHRSPIMERNSGWDSGDSSKAWYSRLTFSAKVQVMVRIASWTKGTQIPTFHPLGKTPRFRQWARETKVNLPLPAASDWRQLQSGVESGCRTWAVLWGEPDYI